MILNLKIHCFLRIAAIIGFVWSLSNAEYIILGDESYVIQKGVIEGFGYPYYHPSNPFEAADGTILVFCSVGSAETETKIVCFRLEGSNWVEYDMGTSSNADAAITMLHGDRIYCYYYTGNQLNQKYKYSDDHGKTWSQAVSIGPDTDALGHQNNPKQDADGSWMAIGQTCDPQRCAIGDGSSKFDRNPSSDPSSISNWTHETIQTGWGNGDIFIKDPDVLQGGRYKHLRAVIRTDFGGGTKSYAQSDDAGASWSTMNFTYTVSVDCPDQWDDLSIGAACRTGVSLDINGGSLRGKHLMVTAFRPNYCEYLGYPGSANDRSAMALFTSSSAEYNDWDLKFVVREDAAENADPGLIQASDGTVWLTWTGRGCPLIRYVQFDPYKIYGATNDRVKRISANNMKKSDWNIFPMHSRVLVEGNVNDLSGSALLVYSINGALIRKYDSFTQSLSRNESNTFEVKNHLLPGVYAFRIAKDHRILFEKAINVIK